MSAESDQPTKSKDLIEWFRSIGVLRQDGRFTVPVLSRCATCRTATGCGDCPGCGSGQVCHHLAPCPDCGLVQEAPPERLIRHPLHRQLYGEAPENEVFNTSNGILFVQSVAAVGIIDPIVVLEPEEDDDTGAQAGDLLVLSGWRRLLAARSLGAARVPIRIIDSDALPRRADIELLIVSANLQREKTIDEMRGELQAWKRALAEASIRISRQWELRAALKQLTGTSTRAIRRADNTAATDRLNSARVKLGARGESPAASAQTDTADVGAATFIARLRQHQQPGDLRGNDIVSALTERNEALLSTRRDEVIHDSINRASQTAGGTAILDVKEYPPLWPENPPDAEGPPRVIPANGSIALLPTVATAHSVGRTKGKDSDPAGLPRNLSIHRGTPDSKQISELHGVDLILSAPSWIEPLASPMLTPPHIRYVADWRDRLRSCLRSWRAAIRDGGRLLLIVPVSTPFHPGLPVLLAAIEELHAAEWAIGGTLVLDDPSLHGPLYAVPDADRVLAPKGPARLILTAAPVAPDSIGPLEDRWRQAWATPLPGRQSRQVASVEEAALANLWKYAGPGRRSRWLPDFDPGLTYHLVRIFSRPDTTVLLPEMGGVNFVRGCLRTGRQIVAFAELEEQISDVLDRIQGDPDIKDESVFQIDTDGEGAFGQAEPPDVS